MPETPSRCRVACAVWLVSRHVTQCLVACMWNRSAQCSYRLVTALQQPVVLVSRPRAGDCIVGRMAELAAYPAECANGSHVAPLLLLLLCASQCSWWCWLCQW
eukprot:GHRQ01030201.1.p1 GENE.GHRQ01030201.1~~GHRQ01030201.1.p1  ORF type:complete len:112 (+),score=4.04 GHRQ01030201.1:29-337(+)